MWRGAFWVDNRQTKWMNAFETFPAAIQFSLHKVAANFSCDGITKRILYSPRPRGCQKWPYSCRWNSWIPLHQIQEAPTLYQHSIKNSQMSRSITRLVTWCSRDGLLIFSAISRQEIADFSPRYRHFSPRNHCSVNRADFSRDYSARNRRFLTEKSLLCELGISLLWKYENISFLCFGSHKT